MMHVVCELCDRNKDTSTDKQNPEYCSCDSTSSLHSELHYPESP